MNMFQFFRGMLPGLLVLGGAQGLSGAPAAGPVSSLVPEQAGLCIEVFQPKAVLEALLSPAVRERVTALPIYAPWRTTQAAKDIAGLVSLFEVTAQTNWQGITRKLACEGAAFAVGAGNRHLLVLAGDDAALLERLHKTACQIASSEAEKQGQADRVRSAEYAGVTGWTFDGKEAHAVVGSRLLAASDREVLKRVLEIRESGSGSLADLATYQAARKAVGADAAAMVFLDMEQARQIPNFLKGLEQQRQNPLMALLLAGLPGSLKTAPWVALGVYLEPRAVCIRAFFGGDGAPEAMPFARVGSQGAPPCLEVPRLVATMSLYRDLAGFYAAKDELFPQRTSGLIFFENMMGIFFSGKNLTDEVLAQTQPSLRLVVASQQYDPAIGTPEPQLPGFALVLGLRDPKAFGEVLEEAWQKALGLVNFTSGQKALPGLIIDRVDHRGTPITVARYSAKDVPDRSHVDQRFNFRPSLALAHGHAILSSTEQLARDLVDALGRQATAASGKAHSVAQVNGTELTGLLKANRPTLVRGNMLKEGKSQPEAEIAIDTLCALVGLADRAHFEAGGGARNSAAELRLFFSKP